jgi:hypothetical protein
MKRHSIVLAFLSALILPLFGEHIPVQAVQQWSKYIPEKDRKQIRKKTTKAVSSAFSNGTAIVTWVTDETAQVLVSTMIDRERLSNSEADKRYAAMRTGQYTFFVRVHFVMVGREPIGIHRHSTTELADPIKSETIFLQRADDAKVFARGTATQTSFNVSEGVAEDVSTYLVSFSKADDDGKPIVRALSDSIEFQFELAGKKSKAKFALQDIATTLDTL